ncbi:hypothetical protein [Bacillus sp. FJAT-29814]|uniref:hypothetical protein n=1 Tax=Bacillus sp. FJAT-29814 TaxID=1729688 RepID=UPI000834DCE0|nr:hypothetical protein [Bacillus sp. FJAT-29814]
MNRHFDEQWKMLREIGSTDSQKAAVKGRVLHSIQNGQSKRRMAFLGWKGFLAVASLLVVFSSFLYMVMGNNPHPQNAVHYSLDHEFFSWKLEDVKSQNTGDHLELFRKDNSVPFGTVSILTEEEKSQFVHSKSMFVERELENFPYKMTMYIEHVKMDVALRYYFYIPIEDEDKNWLQFTFDYPTLQYSEIFWAMATLELKGKEPSIHSEPLYVAHGYGTLPFPIDLKPISITSHKEVYRWEGASFSAYDNYLKKILEGALYVKKDSGTGNSNTIVSKDGNEIVSITLDGNKLTYEFSYPNQEE